MTITLTSDFSKQSMDGYTVCYASKTAAVFALHETNDQFAAAGLSDVTLEQYAALVMQNNSSRNPSRATTSTAARRSCDFYNEDKGRRVLPPRRCIRRTTASARAVCEREGRF